MGSRVVRREVEGECIRISVGNLEGKSLIGRSRRSRGDTVVMDLQRSRI
jgi:hypothetical protein